MQQQNASEQTIRRTYCVKLPILNLTLTNYTDLISAGVKYNCGYKTYSGIKVELNVCMIRLLHNTDKLNYHTHQHYCTLRACYKSWCSPATVGVGNSSDRTEHTRLIIAECLVRQTDTVIEGSGSHGSQLNVHGLLLRNTVEFTRHSIRSLGAITYWDR